MALDGVIFDVDGTLIDTNWWHVEAWVRALSAYGYRIPADRIALEIGKGGDHLVLSILGPSTARRDRGLRTALATSSNDRHLDATLRSARHNPPRAGGREPRPVPRMAAHPRQPSAAPLSSSWSQRPTGRPTPSTRSKP